MRPIDTAIEILAATEDGNKLSRADLQLTELAANDNLSENGVRMLEELHAQIAAGTYDPTSQYLFGIEHLTRDPQGYVYWRNRCVEHYSHQDAGEMRSASLKLAQRCLELEARGFKVSGRSAIEPVYDKAPAGTPWLQAMDRFYTLFEGSNRHVAILSKDGTAIVLERNKETATLTTQLVASAYEAFHYVQGQGLTSLSPIQSYAQFTEFFEAAGLSSQDIEQALA